MNDDPVIHNPTYSLPGALSSGKTFARPLTPAAPDNAYSSSRASNQKKDGKDDQRKQEVHQSELAISTPGAAPPQPLRRICDRDQAGGRQPITPPKGCRG